MTDPDKFEAVTYHDSDTVWVMVWDSKREEKHQVKFDPEALEDEEVRKKASETIAEMLKLAVEGGENDGNR